MCLGWNYGQNVKPFDMTVDLQQQITLCHMNCDILMNLLFFFCLSVGRSILSISTVKYLNRGYGILYPIT